MADTPTPVNTQLFLAISDLDAGALVDLLQRHAVHPDAPRRHGRTLMTQACCIGNAQIVTALLAAGADPNLPDDDRDYPLHAAVWSEQIAIGRLLLQNGARTDTVGAGGSLEDIANHRCPEFLDMVAPIQAECQAKRLETKTPPAHNKRTRRHL